MNRNFTYLLVYDQKSSNINSKVLHQYVSDSKHINGWWHHLPGVYIFNSPLSADELAEQFKNVLDFSKFLIVEINSANSNGWLPQKAWNWLQTEAKPVKQITHDDDEDDIPF